MDIWQILLSAAIVLMLLVVAVLAIPGIANATQTASHSGPQANLANYGSTSENGSAGFFGIGTATPTRILTVTGTGPGTVPWFQRGTDSAGFIIERTDTNRWVLGVNESPALGKGFVLSTYPVGAGSSTPRLMVDLNGRVYINSTTSDKVAALTAYSPPGYNGLYGKSDSWNGVLGMSSSGTGVAGGSDSHYGVLGSSNTSYGVYGTSGSSDGVRGESTSGYGVNGSSAESYGVYGKSTGYFPGVVGDSTLGAGVYGSSRDYYGVWGQSTYGEAGHFTGPVTVTGFLTKSGGGFKIDNPQDPDNKYLQHSFVESPDMKNVYDGMIALDNYGEAVVNMPSYFESLNRDFRYQLTAMGAPGPNLYVADEINSNHFRIAGGKPGMKVSWQVTGVRQDAFANAHPIVVEQDKPTNEKGLYLHPKELGQPESKMIDAGNKR